MKEIFEKCGIVVNDLQTMQFERYFELLCEYNAKFNLTAITERKQVYIKHFADSAVFGNFFPKNAKVLDMGSGAGFPGVVLAIMRPDLQITLLDSVAKKTFFLEVLKKELNLSVEIVNCRIEDYVEAKEQFDVVTARAVAPLSTLMEYGAFASKVGGKLAFYKTAKEEEKWQKTAEILGLNRLKGLFFSQSEFALERQLVIFDKLYHTPANYPRKANKARKMPLF